MKQDKTNTASLQTTQQLALHYMETLVDVAREPLLILDRTLRVVSANPTFYQVFQVSQPQTEGKFVYELGNGQWDIPELRKLLEQVLPNRKKVTDYEVTHMFQNIGAKTILLNAKQIDAIELIILAMEDITERRALERKLEDYTKSLEIKVAERTAELADQVAELQSLNKTMVGRELKMVELKKEIEELRKQRNNSGGKAHGNDADAQHA
jgi:nitrogen-specific signal transduction histidine kinase